ncbi:ComF family protein [Leuconostoc rapi]|uniref:ComF family protein n=1 Tax=Leuconostoc rapi TaxID=1406906 RepID=UPI00195DB975|nr:competence protein ComFC [Leuconostoc rapi]
MTCRLCQEFLDDHASLLQTFGFIKWQKRQICQVCEATFSLIKTGCLGCGRNQDTQQLCYDCQRWQQQGKQLLNHQALYQYNDAMRQFMQQYKFNGDYALRAIFNHELIQKVQTIATDMVVPIPVSQHTMFTRGFNQTTGLIAGIKYQSILQVRTTQKSHQSQFNRQERLTREQIFTVKEGVSLQGKQILLIDDVYTTGNTLFHAADLLYELGAENVKSLSLAR